MSDANPAQLSDHKRKRRWYQFTLRSLLLLTVLFGVLLTYGLSVWRQYQAVTTIREHGGSVRYEFQTKLDWNDHLYGRGLYDTFPPPVTFDPALPEDPPFLATYLGADAFHDVSGVFLDSPDEECWQAVLRLPRLRQLMTSMKGDQFADLKRLRGLERATFFLSSNEGFESIDGMTNLRELNLSAEQRLSPENWTTIAKFGQLQSLYLDVGECLINYQDVQSLSQLPQLVRLRLNGVEASAVRANHLQSLKQLAYLEVTFWNAISDEALESIANSSTLRTLRIQGEASDLALPRLLQLHNLENLEIISEAVTDNFLSGLTSLPKLRRLSLGNCVQVTDAGVAKLAELESLEELAIGGRWGKQLTITDASFAEISKLSNLRSLYLFQCAELTEKGAHCLASLSKLRELLFMQVPNLTEPDLTTLRALLPNCTINSGYIGSPTHK